MEGTGTKTEATDLCAIEKATDLTINKRLNSQQPSFISGTKKRPLHQQISTSITTTVPQVEIVQPALKKPKASNELQISFSNPQYRPTTTPKKHTSAKGSVQEKTKLTNQHRCKCKWHAESYLSHFSSNGKKTGALAAHILNHSNVACTSGLSNQETAQSRATAEKRNNNSSTKLKGLLDRPTPIAKGNNNVCAVVHDMLSRPHKPNLQKYVVMPVIQPSISNINTLAVQPIKYVLVNTTASTTSLREDRLKPIDLSKKSNKPSTNHVKTATTPISLIIRQPHVSSRDCKQVFRPQYRHNSTCCKAIITSKVDTVSKWLDCNRDILHKTLHAITERLKISDTVSLLLFTSQKQPTEHVVLKWMGIGLMLLIKHQINQTVGNSGKPIPSSLYFMWNSIRNFFMIFEGCFQITRALRTSGTSNLPSDALKVEDQAFSQVIETMFNQYNKMNPTVQVPTTSNLHMLAEFIASLEDGSSTAVSCDNNPNQVITSILDREMRFGPKLTVGSQNSNKRTKHH